MYQDSACTEIVYGYSDFAPDTHTVWAQWKYSGFEYSSRIIYRIIDSIGGKYRIMLEQIGVVVGYNSGAMVRALDIRQGKPSPPARGQPIKSPHIHSKYPTRQPSKALTDLLPRYFTITYRSFTILLVFNYFVH